MPDYYENWDVEDFLTEIAGDARAIHRIVDDISDKISLDDSYRLHAIMKLSEDQDALIDRIIRMRLSE